MSPFESVQTEYGPTGFIWCHYGDYGDTIYSLSAVYDLCHKSNRKAEYHFYWHSGARHPMDPEHAAGIIPLLLAQPYIAASEFHPKPYGMKLDSGICKFAHHSAQLGDHYQHWLNLPFGDRLQPWLTVPQKKALAPVVIARSARYHGEAFPWRRIVDTTSGNAVFVGTTQEHKDFCLQFGHVPYQPTKDLLDLACVIAGAELFIGNQSCPRAIAEGLKVAVVVEEAVSRTGPADTHYERPNAWYGTTSDFWCPVLDVLFDSQHRIGPPAILFEGSDPLPHAYVANNPTWFQSARVENRHRKAFLDLCSRNFRYSGGSGRGVVTAGEGAYWASLVVMLRRLRASGCTLPVECWYRGSAGVIRPEQVADLGVTLLNIDVVGRHHSDSRIPTGNPNLGGWEAKLYALTHSKFDTCLWLDADLYTLADPTPLLDEAERHGLAIWVDHTAEAKQHLQWPKVWPMGSTSMPYFSGGQYAVHRPSVWRELVLAHWLCQHSDYYFNYMLGDQDALRVAFAATNRSFHDLGEIIKLPQGTHLYRYDYRGQPLLIHRSGSKLLEFKLPLEWEVAQEFATALKPDTDDALLQIATRSLLSLDRLQVLRDCVIATNHLHGDLAEVGVFRGGSARLMGTFAPGAKLHLYDTFAGIPEDDVRGRHQAGDFVACLEEVRSHLANPNALFHVGKFPQTAIDGVRYRLVHLDGDTYQTTQAAIAYFTPRMVAGGMIVFDDYQWLDCPGVAEAIHQAYPTERIARGGQYQAIVRF